MSLLVVSGRTPTDCRGDIGILVGAIGSVLRRDTVRRNPAISWMPDAMERNGWRFLQRCHLHVVELAAVKLTILHLALKRFKDSLGKINLLEPLRTAQTPRAKNIDLH